MYVPIIMEEKCVIANIAEFVRQLIGSWLRLFNTNPSTTARYRAELLPFKPFYSPFKPAATLPNSSRFWCAKRGSARSMDADRWVGIGVGWSRWPVEGMIVNSWRRSQQPMYFNRRAERYCCPYLKLYPAVSQDFLEVKKGTILGQNTYVLDAEGVVAIGVARRPA